MADLEPEANTIIVTTQSLRINIFLSIKQTNKYNKRKKSNSKLFSTNKPGRGCSKIKRLKKYFRKKNNNRNKKKFLKEFSVIYFLPINGVNNNR